MISQLPVKAGAFLKEKLNTQPGYFYAYCLGALIGYFLIIHHEALPGFPLGGPGDYSAFYTAGKIVAQNRGDQLYDPVVQADVQRELLQDHKLIINDGFYPYFYPPFAAAIFAMFSLLPFGVSYFAWNIVNVGILTLCVRLIQKSGKREIKAQCVCAMIATMSFFPVYASFRNGQTSIVLLLIITIWYKAIRCGRQFTAGIGNGIMLIKPQFALCMLGWLLFCRHWRALMLSFITFAALFCASWIIVGYSGFKIFGEMIVRVSSWDVPLRTINVGAMPNVRGSGYRLQHILRILYQEDVPAWPIQMITVIGSIFIIAIIVRVWRICDRHAAQAYDLQISITLIGMLLLSPHLHVHDLSILILPAFLVGRYYQERKGRTWQRGIIGFGHFFVNSCYIIMPIEWAAQMVAFGMVISMGLLMRELGCHEAKVVNQDLWAAKNS